MKIYILIFFHFALTTSSYAASCCGGGGGSQLITGDFRSVFAVEGKYGSVIGDVDTNGEATFRHKKNNEEARTATLKASYLFSDYWQIGVTLPYVERRREIGSRNHSTTGLGDVSAFTAFEWLPEKEYSPWQPRGFVSLRVTAPTAPSIYDFKEPLAADARGQGLYLVGLSFPFSKIAGHFDWSISPEIETGFSRDFSNSSGSKTTVEPGIAYLMSVAGGWSPQSASEWRLGASLTPRFETEKRVNGVLTTEKTVWTSGLSTHYAFDSYHALSLLISDQTLVGPARNTTLERSIALSYEVREAL